MIKGRMLSSTGSAQYRLGSSDRGYNNAGYQRMGPAPGFADNQNKMVAAAVEHDGAAALAAQQHGGGAGQHQHQHQQEHQVYYMNIHNMDSAMNHKNASGGSYNFQEDQHQVDYNELYIASTKSHGHGGEYGAEHEIQYRQRPSKSSSDLVSTTADGTSPSFPPSDIDATTPPEWPYALPDDSYFLGSYNNDQQLHQGSSEHQYQQNQGSEHQKYQHQGGNAELYQSVESADKVGLAATGGGGGEYHIANAAEQILGSGNFPPDDVEAEHMQQLAGERTAFEFWRREQAKLEQQTKRRDAAARALAGEEEHLDLAQHVANEYYQSGVVHYPVDQSEKDENGAPSLRQEMESGQHNRFVGSTSREECEFRSVQYDRLRTLLQASKTEDTEAVRRAATVDGSSRYGQGPGLRFIPATSAPNTYGNIANHASSTDGSCSSRETFESMARSIAPELLGLSDASDLSSIRLSGTSLAEEVKMAAEAAFDNPVPRLGVTDNHHDDYRWGSDLQPVKLSYSASPEDKHLRDMLQRERDAFSRNFRSMHPVEAAAASLFSSATSTSAGGDNSCGESERTSTRGQGEHSDVLGENEEHPQGPTACGAVDQNLLCWVPQCAAPHRPAPGLAIPPGVIASPAPAAPPRRTRTTPGTAPAALDRDDNLYNLHAGAVAGPLVNGNGTTTTSDLALGSNPGFRTTSTSHSYHGSASACGANHVASSRIAKHQLAQSGSKNYNNYFARTNPSSTTAAYHNDASSSPLAGLVNLNRRRIHSNTTTLASSPPASTSQPVPVPVAAHLAYGDLLNRVLGASVEGVPSSNSDSLGGTGITNGNQTSNITDAYNSNNNYNLLHGGGDQSVHGQAGLSHKGAVVGNTQNQQHDQHQFHMISLMSDNITTSAGRVPLSAGAAALRGSNVQHSFNAHHQGQAAYHRAQTAPAEQHLGQHLGTSEHHLHHAANLLSNHTHSSMSNSPGHQHPVSNSLLINSPLDQHQNETPIDDNANGVPNLFACSGGLLYNTAKGIGKNFLKGIVRYHEILNPGPGSFSALHPVIQEQIGLYQKRQRLGSHKLDTSGVLHVTSFLINRYFHKINAQIDNQECWHMLWQLVDYMERHTIPSNSRIWCMMCSAFERYRPDGGADLYYPTLLRQFYTFTSPQSAYYNAHADAALIRLMCFCGYVDDAHEMLNNRRNAYKVGSHNFQFRFLLFQALLDFARVHSKGFNTPGLSEKCLRIERDVRQWIEEDGIDNVDDIASGSVVARDPARQRYFLNVKGETATHSRQRSLLSDGKDKCGRLSPPLQLI
ncbi:unnamed protein product [Amoebophrya sp. A25]|nr:unnamed protein product [Amoebophrya sp. A25]|eukprot:GSA25T00022754001.1